MSEQGMLLMQSKMRCFKVYWSWRILSEYWKILIAWKISSTRSKFVFLVESSRICWINSLSEQLNPAMMDGIEIQKTWRSSLLPLLGESETEVNNSKTYTRPLASTIKLWRIKRHILQSLEVSVDILKTMINQSKRKQAWELNNWLKTNSVTSDHHKLIKIWLKVN